MFEDSKVDREKHRMDTIIEIENMFRKLCGSDTCEHKRNGSQCKVRDKYDRAPVTVNEVLNWFVLKCVRKFLKFQGLIDLGALVPCRLEPCGVQPPPRA